MSEILSLKEVADFLKLNERTIRILQKRGDLPGFKMGREWRFEKDDVLAYIAQQKEKARVQSPNE